MGYIWNRDTLESLLHHDNEDIQAWAALRLLDLYPETTSELLERLPHLPTSLVSVILNHRRLRQVSVPLSLQDMLATLSNPFLKARLVALLLGVGQTPTAEQMSMLEQGNAVDLLAETEAGFAYLLSSYQEAPRAAGRFCHALALACGCTDIFVRLEEDTRRKDWRELVGELEKAWGCSLTTYKNIRRAREAMAALEQALRTMPQEAASSSPWQQELWDALAPDHQRLMAVATAARDRLSRFSDIELPEVAFLLSCALALQRNARCWTLLQRATNVADLWHSMTIRPWRVKGGVGLQDFLRRFEPQTVVSSLEQALKRLWTYADYPLQLLNTLELPGRFALFLKLFRQERGEQIAEEATMALHAARPQVISFLLEQYRQDLPEPWELNLVLAETPTPEVEEFLVEQFEHYIRHPDVKSFIETLETVASQRFLAPLQQEWRSGEPVLGRAITFLANVHGVEDASLQQIKDETAQQQSVWKHIKDNMGEDPDRAWQEMLEERPMTLPLQCTACGRTYHYTPQKIFVDPHGACSVGEIVQCKGCGSIETYEQTAATRLSLTAEVMRLSLLARRQQALGGPMDAALHDSPIIPHKLRLMAAGRYFSSVGEAYRFLQEELHKHPESGELHRRLGLVFKNGGRLDLALPYLQQAIALTPEDEETYYNLVDIFIEQKRYDEAIPHLETLIHLCREGQMDEQHRRDVFGGLLEQVRVLERETHHHFTLISGLLPHEPVQAVGILAESPTVPLTSLDVSNPQEFERAYQGFVTGILPEPARQGALPSLSRTFSGGEGFAEEDVFTPLQPVRVTPKVGRNALCPCGSGKKYKKCCGR